MTGAMEGRKSLEGMRGKRKRGKGGTEGKRGDIYMEEERKGKEREKCIVEETRGRGETVTAVESRKRGHEGKGEEVTYIEKRGRERNTTQWGG